MGRSGPDALQAHYARGLERARLDSPAGVVELERTKEILGRHLPPPPAVVADIGGGPGRYALWLAALGYHVRHRDIVALHVEQLRAEAGAWRGQIDTAVGDARALDLPDGCVDAVLLLGPLYHLAARRDRLRALGEAARIVRPGGVVFAAAVSRWAPRLDGVLRLRLDREFPSADDDLKGVERTGRLAPLFPGSFSGYCHRPGQLRAEARAAGLDVVAVVGVEGLSNFLADLAARLGDPDGRRVVLESARAVEAVPELLGASPHLLAVARRP